MSGKKGMKHFSETIINEIKQMVSVGKTHREVAEYFGLKDKEVIKSLLKRERNKEKRIQAGIIPRPKGRPRKSSITSEQSRDAEIRRLKMEVELLRSFLQIAGKK
jgi:hypothetical protein